MLALLGLATTAVLPGRGGAGKGGAAMALTLTPDMRWGDIRALLREMCMQRAATLEGDASRRWHTAANSVTTNA